MSFEGLINSWDSWDDVVLKIDDVEIEGVQRSHVGVFRFKDRNRRSKVQRSRLGEWRGYRITSMSLRKLVWIYGRLRDNNLQVIKIDPSLLAEIVKRMLRCSTQTAYNYTNALLALGLRCPGF